MRELAEVLKRRAGLRMRQGVVTAVTGSTCSVRVGGSSVPVDGVQHLNSCAPQVDDVVWVASDGADLWIIGTHGDPPPIELSRLPEFETYFTESDPAGAPAAVTGLVGVAGPAGVQLSWDLPPEALWRTWEIYEGTAQGFTPGEPVLTSDTTVVTVPNAPGTGPLWYKVRAVNTRGEWSEFVEVGPFTVPAVALADGSVMEQHLADAAVDLEGLKVTGLVREQLLADNAVTQAKLADSAVGMGELAAGIMPPRVVDVLPTLQDWDYPGGSTVLLKSDGKLYKTLGGGPNDNAGADKAKWQDLSGEENDGTLIGWTYADGDRWDGSGTEADPYCLECAGVNTQYVACAGGGPTGDFSVDVWVYIDNVADNHGLLIGRNYSGPSGWGLFANASVVEAFLVTTNYTDVIFARISSAVSNAWRHFGASFDRDGYMRVYRDGVYVAQADISSKAALDLSARHPYLFQYPGWAFQGKIAAAREYNRVLSDAEFAQNYAAGPNGKGYVKDGLVLDLNAAKALRTSEWLPVLSAADIDGQIEEEQLSPDVVASIDDAQDTADIALTTANGKNRVIFSTSDASGTDYTTGDIWFKKSGSLIVAEWEFVDGAWASRTLDNAVIANLDAGKITTGTLDAARIAAGSITADKLVANSITAGQIAAGAIGADELAANAVVAGKIAAGAVDADQIVAGAVTAGKIAARSIAADRIVTGAITANEIAASTITAAKLDVADVQAAVVTAEKVNALALNAGSITTGTLSVDRLAAGSIKAAKLDVADVQAAVVTASAINAVTIDAVKITGGTITSAKVQTAASGMRLVIGETDYIGAMRIYTGLSTETAPAYVLSGSTGSLVMASADLGSGATSIELEAGGDILMNGNLDIDGSLVASKSIKPSTDWVSGTSDDGIWIQDKNANTLEKRWKLYFDSANKKLWVRNGTTYYGIVLS